MTSREIALMAQELLYHEGRNGNTKLLRNERAFIEKMADRIRFSEGQAARIKQLWKAVFGDA